MRRCGPALFVALLLLPSTVQAQAWTVAASAGGTTHDAVAADVGTRSAMLGIMYEGAAWFYVTGGLPLDAESVPWGAGGVGTRPATRIGAFEGGFDLAADGHAYRVDELEATGAGATLQALPWLGITRGPARLEAYSGLLQYHRRFGPTGQDDLVTRTMHDSGVEGSLNAGSQVHLSMSSRYIRAEEGDYPFFGGSATYSADPVQAWASAGKWWIDSADELGWEVGAGIEIGSATGVYASLAHEPSDPVYWNAPRRQWTVGISRWFGRAPEAGAPLPVVPIDAEDQVAFRLPRALSNSPPAIAGDFTGWEPRIMQAEGDDWVIRLALEPGSHHYVYIREDGSWFVPDFLPSVDDGFGGTSAIIIVQ